MSIARGTSRRARVVFALIVLSALPAFGQKARIQVEDYQIDAEIVPQTHYLKAQAKVRFRTLGDIDFADFELHNALHVTRILYGNGETLSAERMGQNGALRVAFTNRIAGGSTNTLTFDYEGALANAGGSPVKGLKLAYISEDITYLLYPGCWFPVSNYGIDRFTATVNLAAPAGTVIVGSGSNKSDQGAAAGKTAASFSWQKPGFPGSIIAGPFQESVLGDGNVHVYFTTNKKQFASSYGQTAIKELDFFKSIYGPPPSRVLKVVELPDDTVPAWSAPEIAALARRDIGEKTNYRLLANTVARQWWGGTVSPASKEDWWVVDGGARVSEMMYVQRNAGQAGFEESTRDMAVGALAYHTVPLSSVGKLNLFSPEFQALVADKGGMILHMLRWMIGEAAFDKTMRDLMAVGGGKATRAADLQAAAEKNYGQTLTAFFSYWVNGAGAPELKMKYTVFPMKKGFRIVGLIIQDPDLFRMPLELNVETAGLSEMKRIELVGPESPFSVETFGKPRRLVLDPNNWILKNSLDMKPRVAIRRGQDLTAQGHLAEALAELNKALEWNKNSSLAHYRVADVFYLLRDYQSAANQYRASLDGDGEPRWTAVWSHVMLGKIFDLTGQREQAVNEYRQAIQTFDNSQGALDEARERLQQPLQRN